ncbi:transposase [Streptomyces sp. WAC 06738]|nr:transposase [Streptomyces sp. WAC 06738]
MAAQAAVRSVKKTVDAYTTLRVNVRAGNLGPPGSQRRVRAESKPIVFRPDAAQPYDDRILSWQHDARTVSIWTTDGRLKGVCYVGHPEQVALLAKYRKGESDLVHRAGKWLLLAVCEVPEPTVAEPSGWIGVDRGVAQRTGRGIAVEDLGGIRERVRPSRDQRAALSSWPFRQLGKHLAYKCRRAGVAFLEVDARHASQRCPRCGHTERGNRPARDRFRCRRCGLAGPADHVAGVNVRERARLAWGFVNSPALQET